VAIRPLCVEELVEVLAIDFDDAEGVPKLNPDWRWEDHEQALLSSCSSLITIVNADDSRVVQFSHFSVKEFLISPRLCTPSKYASYYHVNLEDAHMTLAQACLGVLLQLDGHLVFNDVKNSYPLATYAARYWVRHAQYEKVSLQVQKAMEYLFDQDQPYFILWLRVYDIDTRAEYPSIFRIFVPREKSGASPLYYAALCGFHDLAERLIVKNPEQVNADGGFFLRPLVAALAGQHFRTAELLHHNGADPDIKNSAKRTPMYAASYFGDL
jgi:hypothetical protein